MKRNQKKRCGVLNDEKGQDESLLTFPFKKQGTERTTAKRAVVLSFIEIGLCP